jgi:hypothetical protein
MFAGRYENASDKPDRVSAPVKIRADCRLDFASGGGEKKPAAGFQQRNDSRPIKKIQENIVLENHRKKNPENIKRKKHREKKPGSKKNRKPDARPEPFFREKVSIQSLFYR